MPDTPTTEWVVVAQTPNTVGEDPNTGRSTRGVEITFTTGTGQRGQVFIPYSSYSVAEARAIIAAHAAKVDAIGQLSSGG